MSGFTAEKIFEIADMFSESNVYISLDDQNQTMLKGTTIPFDNIKLKQLLKDQHCAVKEYIFLPRNRSFLVRLYGDRKMTASSYAHPREYEEMFHQIEIILDRSETKVAN